MIGSVFYREVLQTYPGFGGARGGGCQGAGGGTGGPGGFRGAGGGLGARSASAAPEASSRSAMRIAMVYFECNPFICALDRFS